MGTIVTKISIKPVVLSWKMSFFAFICHQKEDRCFRFRDKTMPVCSRCFGFYIFIAAGAFIYIVGENLRGITEEIDMATAFIFFLSMQFPMMIDGTLQYKTSYESTNIRRFVTGMISGLGFGAVIAWSLYFFVF